MEHKEAMNKDNIQIDLNMVSLIKQNEDLMKKNRLQADRIKELEDDKKKLDEDWKELDSDCMILHDKNKQLKKENKALKENVKPKGLIYDTLVKKGEMIDKVVEVVENEVIMYKNILPTPTSSEQINIDSLARSIIDTMRTELINQIRKV
jgi:predicted nuclease with TOPRIM domain